MTAEEFFTSGNALRDQGRLRQAVTAYTQALALQPDFYEALVQIGPVLYKLQRYVDAVGYFRQALQIKPDTYETVFNLGAALTEALELGESRLDEAVDSLERAIALNSERAETHVALAYAL